MKISKQKLTYLLLFYCYLPIIIFMIGWLRWYVCAVALLAICATVFSWNRHTIKLNEEYIEMSKVTFGTVIIAIIVLCTILGMGHLYPQSWDYAKHNAVVHDLVNYQWPVVYSKYDNCMLTYYIGQYLVPALVGKIFHSCVVAELVMGIYGVIGITLLYLYLLSVVKANTSIKQFVVLIIFFLFSGLMYPLNELISSLNIDNFYSIENRAINYNDLRLEYRSMLTIIRWVYPQCIIPFIGALLLLDRRTESKYFAMFILPSIICGTWSFISLCIYAMVIIMYTIVTKQNSILKCFSWENVVVSLIPGLICILYLMGDITSKPEILKISFVITSYKKYLVKILFVVFMYGGFLTLLFCYSIKQSVIFYTSLFLLFFIPNFRMGVYNDWVMCTSLPVILYVLVFILQFLLDGNKWYSIKKLTVIILLAIGSIYSIEELLQLVNHCPCFEYTGETLVNFTNKDDESIDLDVRYNYYTYNLDDSFFYQYIAKRNE